MPPIRQPSCPRCRSTWLDVCYVEGHERSVCARCGGLWCSAERWDVDALGPRPDVPAADPLVTVAAPDAGERLACPDCRDPMAEVRVTEVQGLSIDLCRQCGGVWFDRREWSYLEALRAWQRDLPEIERRTTWGEWFFQMVLRLPVEFNITPRRTPVATVGIIAVCVVFQLLAFVPAWRDALAAALALTSANLGSTVTVLRLVGHQFLHAGWLHLLPNMYLLYVLGDNVEDVLGHGRFALFYVACGAAAALTQAAVAGPPTPDMPLLGASGAIAGLFAAYVCLFRRARLTFVLLFWQYKPPAIVWIGIWLLLQVAAAAIDPIGERSGIAWWAHLGGFAAGLLFVLPVRARLVAAHPLLYLLDTRRIEA